MALQRVMRELFPSRSHQHVFHPGRSLLLAVISLLFSLPLSHAQVTQTPGTGGLNTQVNQVGNVYEITQGTQTGSNLFHSFETFSVGPMETARFQTINLVPDVTVDNVLGRVTGGTPSNILGAINSATYYPNANLFLMNPAGFLFGPGATVNVGGMVAFTSADYLRLGELGDSNAGIFHADPTQASLLTSVPVAAFGFLGSNPGAITVQGSQFTVTEGRGISLVGGRHHHSNRHAGRWNHSAGRRCLRPVEQINLAECRVPRRVARDDVKSKREHYPRIHNVVARILAGGVGRESGYDTNSRRSISDRRQHHLGRHRQ